MYMYMYSNCILHAHFITFFSHMKDGLTALSKAASEGHLGVVSKLIDSKANLDYIDKVSAIFSTKASKCVMPSSLFSLH